MVAIGSSEVMDLFCHIISQGHVIKVSCNFMVEASQAKVATGSGSEDKILWRMEKKNGEKKHERL